MRKSLKLKEESLLLDNLPEELLAANDEISRLRGEFHKQTSGWRDLENEKKAKEELVN